MFETNGATAGSFGDLFVYGLPLDYYGLLPQELASVTSAQLTALALRYLDPSSMIIVAVGDRKQIEKALAPLKLGPTVVWTIQDAVAASPVAT